MTPLIGQAASPFVLAGVYLLFTALFSWAAWSDITSRRIPDASWQLLLLAGLALFPFQLDAAAMALHLSVGLVAFALLLLLFRLKAMGGGDVKLWSTAALLAGPSAIVPQLFWTAVAGGLLGLLLLALHKAAGRRGKLPKVPYGVAIALGSLASLYRGDLFAGLTSLF